SSKRAPMCNIYTEARSWRTRVSEHAPKSAACSEPQLIRASLVLDQTSHEVRDRQALESRSLGEHRLDRFALFRRELPRDGAFELVHQHRNRLGAPLAMATRIVHGHSLSGRAVPEEHLNRIADVALVRRVILLCEGRVLANLHLR